MLQLLGANAFSPFRLQKRAEQIRRTVASVTDLTAHFVHFVELEQELTTNQHELLLKLLDSRGTDLKIVADGVNTISKVNQGVLVITHYQRILNYIKPDFVHVMLNGKLVQSGGPELALRLEEEGYEWLREKHAA